MNEQLVTLLRQAVRAEIEVAVAQSEGFGFREAKREADHLWQDFAEWVGKE